MEDCCWVEDEMKEGGAGLDVDVEGGEGIKVCLGFEVVWRS